MTKNGKHDIPRVRLRLKDLKAREDLVEIYQSFRCYLSKFFENGSPVPEFFEQTNCPICKHQKSKVSLKLDNIIYSTCDVCGAVYTPMMLREELLKKMYQSGEYQQYFTKLTLKGQSIRKEVLENRKYKQIETFFTEPGSILDVGCGSGSFLSICQDHGWEVTGLDPSEGAVITGREKYNLHIEKVFFEDYFPKKKFDCVVFFGLEHLQDPRGSVEKAVGLLKTHGVIFIEVPSAECFLMEYVKKFPFEATRFIEAGRHYLFFSRKTFEYMCAEFGINLEMIETNGLDIDTILLGEPIDTYSEKILNIQEVLNSYLLGDHFRVAFRKSQGGKD